MVILPFDVNDDLHKINFIHSSVMFSTLLQTYIIQSPPSSLCPYKSLFQDTASFVIDIKIWFQNKRRGGNQWDNCDTRMWTTLFLLKILLSLMSPEAAWTLTSSCCNVLGFAVVFTIILVYFVVILFTLQYMEMLCLMCNNSVCTPTKTLNSLTMGTSALLCYPDK